MYLNPHSRLKSNEYYENTSTDCEIKLSKNPSFVDLTSNRPVSGISENSVASVAAISRTLALMQRHRERKFTRSAASFPTKSCEVC